MLAKHLARPLSVMLKYIGEAQIKNSADLLEMNTIDKTLKQKALQFQCYPSLVPSQRAS